MQRKEVASRLILKDSFESTRLTFENVCVMSLGEEKVNMVSLLVDLQCHFKKHTIISIKQSPSNFMIQLVCVFIWESSAVSCHLSQQISLGICRKEREKGCKTKLF